jgi:copper chaperone CopZ
MLELIVNDMTCGHCVQRVTQAILHIDPSAQIQTDLERHEVRIESTQPDDKIIEALDEAGYTAQKKTA